MNFTKEGVHQSLDKLQMASGAYLRAYPDDFCTDMKNFVALIRMWVI